MKNRKRGFSLVELLIVLAVIAALIATITPVALNAIQKAKATQVAQNLKTLASAFENKAYVDGANAADGLAKLSDIARDVSSDYILYYTHTAGTFTCVVAFTPTDSVNPDKVIEVLPTAVKVAPFPAISSWKTLTKSNTGTKAGALSSSDGQIFYPFIYSVY
ncbi:MULTISPECIES: type II secretion system protein [unclassified Mesotoga]|jgi:general secretion pathway protein G|uniref:type II secretion system protein n=1 Tax=unclassified Mesotoga TaxID=1184398 RepID=UPI000C17E97C|nr:MULTISPECIES: type II secretion system protein [unclassified Mesotoga]PVD17033.1 N-terminal cleavage protein [Mesotoga sp. Brook.08.105.5.1]RAO95411.1 hypothetical protein M388_06790 [Mesotoga sp. Brook.08.YT.4.2.5.4.]